MTFVHLYFDTTRHLLPIQNHSCDPSTTSQRSSHHQVHSRRTLTDRAHLYRPQISPRKGSKRKTPPHMTTRTRSPTGYPDPTSVNLNRILSRLEHVVLVEPSSQLRKSSYERARVSAVSLSPTSNYPSIVSMKSCASPRAHACAYI